MAGFEKGLSVQASDVQPVDGLRQPARARRRPEAGVQSCIGHGTPATVASAVEFMLEGLHLNKRLNKDEVAGGARYRAK